MRSSRLFKARGSFLPLLFLLAFVYIVWVLSLPAWPSQDGPMHLYYTRVLSALFSSAPSHFRSYFFIKHLLPPYAVYYYALLLLSRVTSLLVADRLVVCIYLVAFLFGFRYAARGIGPNADRMTLLASLLLLNWALGMGFSNYCLSLAFSLWAIGLWLRVADHFTFARAALFIALLWVVTLSHPVPLLLVLAFGGLDMICRFAFARGAEAQQRRRQLFERAATLAGGAVCLVYVKAFTAPNPLQQRDTPMSLGAQIVRRLKDIVTVKNVELLYGSWWEVRVYRIALATTMLVALAFAIRQWRRNRRDHRWTAGDSMLLFTAALFVILPELPSDISGAYYFTERLMLLLWVGALLAGSAWDPSPEAAAEDPSPAEGSVLTSRFTSAILAGGVVLTTALLLHAADRILRPLAVRDYALAHTALPLQGRLAMVVDIGPPVFQHGGPTWDPFFWDTVAVLAQQRGHPGKRALAGLRHHPAGSDGRTAGLQPSAPLRELSVLPRAGASAGLRRPIPHARPRRNRAVQHAPEPRSDAPGRRARCGLDLRKVN